ncbi:hypothetical protein LUX32_17605 [Actinomadura madurae]|nr:hypothetical protein [Actinomadura madurae]MCP9979205.1 hypothetical protein [Actinomadura madurae]
MASTATALAQVNRCTTGSRSATRNSTITIAESTETATVPNTGAPRPLTLPSAAGSTPARDIEKKYRAALFWNASSAANRLDSTSQLISVASHPRRTHARHRR